MQSEFELAYISFLKSILAKFKISSDIVSDKIEGIHIEDDDVADAISVSSNGHYILNAKKIDAEDIRRLKELMVAKVDQDKNYITLKTTEVTRLEFVKDSVANSYEEKLKTLQPYIPEIDFKILRIANRIRSIFRKGENVYRQKDDLIRKYGNRAKNISNLVTAGYFDELVFPMFEKHKSDIGKFLEEYENIITHQAFALFVNKNMSEKILAETIEGKLRSFKEASLDKTLTVHGIGKDNCEKIESAITSLNQKISIKKRNIESNICKIEIEWVEK